MLAKKQRLTKHQFDHYFKIGKRYHSPSLQLIYTPKDSFSGAVVVGKKVFKRAVDRNQLRRRLYGVLYRYQQSTPQTGVYMMIAKPAAKSLSRRAIIDEAKDLLGKVK